MISFSELHLSNESSGAAEFHSVMSMRTSLWPTRQADGRVQNVAYTVSRAALHLPEYWRYGVQPLSFGQHGGRRCTSPLSWELICWCLL
jgi:hypothetical protein